MKKIKINLEIPYEYYYDGPTDDQIVLSVNNRVADMLQRMLAKDGYVEKSDIETKKMLRKLNLLIQEIGYEILIESTFDPDHDCVEDSIMPRMQEDIESGDYTPDLSYIDDEDSEEDISEMEPEDLVETYYDELKDDYLEWCNQFTQEFRAEVYDVNIDYCFEEEVDYEILSVLPDDSDEKVYDQRYSHEWDIEDMLDIY